MSHMPHRGMIPAVAALVLAGLAFPFQTLAQDADFLFKQPSVTLGLRFGYAVPRASSEVFDFTRQELTVEKSDFNALTVAGELAARVHDRVDVAVGLGVARSDTRSEFRDFVGDDDLPIEQDTRFTRVPLTLGAKAYVVERGRRVSRFSWIPNKIAPYVGGGVGYVWYTFEQVGEFVDFDTLEIFLDRFESSSGTPLAYATAGLDLSLGPKWIVNGEARYSWASADMERDFVGFDKIDLAGFAVTLGVSVRL